MQPLPPDYPKNEYSRLGPRSETPPLRPPKPAHMQQSGPADEPQSNFGPVDPPVSATNPTPLTGSERGAVAAVGRHVNGVSLLDSAEGDIDSRTEEGGGGGRGNGGSDEVFVRRSIYDTMTTDGLRTEPKGVLAILGESPSIDNLDARDYDKLALGTGAQPPSTAVTVAASPSPHSGSRKQRKSSVKIFDDPTYSPPLEKTGSSSNGSRADAGSSSKRSRSASVKVVDPRYVGDYERHPSFVPPQIEIPRDQLQEKYRGDYERDPTYFSRNPTRSFSVSATSGTSVQCRGRGDREHRSSLTLGPPVADKYRGDYERSEDYVPPPQRRVWNEDTRTDDYVLEPDPSYTGAYERHPNYVPPLIKRSSKTKIQILSTDTVSSNGVNSDRPNHVPHEYTSLAAVTKDPARQYATLNSDRSTICTLPTGSLKDSMV